MSKRHERHVNHKMYKQKLDELGRFKFDNAQRMRVQKRAQFQTVRFILFISFFFVMLTFFYMYRVRELAWH